MSPPGDQTPFRILARDRGDNNGPLGPPPGTDAASAQDGLSTRHVLYVHQRLSDVVCLQTRDGILVRTTVDRCGATLVWKS